MTDVLALDDIDLTGIDEYPPDASVKLWGPPGTGKTTQSAGRVGRLLEDYGYDLANVAWGTYRKSLAMDTLNRFVEWGFLQEHDLEELHTGSTRYIGTTHAVANRTAGDLPKPAKEWHKGEFCDKLDMQYWAPKPWDDTPGKLLFRTFSWMNNNLLDPGEPADVFRCPVADDLSEVWNGDVPSAWVKWQDYKAQRQIIDFHEQLEAPLDEQVVPTKDIFVIDEYHDATPLMAKLCEFWVSAADIAIVAGDPNQVVNAFDGADPRFFRQLDLPRVLLEETYRVPAEHWRAARKLLSNAHEVPPVTVTSSGQVIEYRSPTFEHSDESGWKRPGPGVEASPPTIIEEYGGDTLFLTRMRVQADGVGAALEKAGIIYGSQKDLNGWNTDGAETRRAIYNALQKLRGFNPGDFGGYGLAQFSGGQSPDSVALSHVEAAEILRHAHASTLAQRRSETETICEKLEEEEESVTLSEFSEWVEEEFWSRYTAAYSSVDRLNKGSLSDRDRVAIEEALRRHDEPFSSEDIDIRVLTIHASKGQEAEDVVVYDGISRRTRREMDASERAYNNEWRTWYVALTRASERLHIMRDGFRWMSSILPANIRTIAGDTEVVSA